MEITDNTLEYLQQLARLQLSAHEKTVIKEDVNQIIGFFNKLHEVDTEHIQPLQYLDYTITGELNYKPESAIDRTTVLQNAPEANNEYFIVPKVFNK